MHSFIGASIRPWRGPSGLRSGKRSHHWAAGVGGFNLGSESDGEGIRGAVTGRTAGRAIRAVGVGRARSEDQLRRSDVPISGADLEWQHPAPHQYDPARFDDHTSGRDSCPFRRV